MITDPTVAPVVHHHIHHAVAHAPAISHGVSMLTTFISSLVSAGVAGGLAWYVRGRGVTGVQNDINNIKADVQKIKSQLPTVSVTPATPVA